jgi:hypothetical protein
MAVDLCHVFSFNVCQVFAWCPRSEFESLYVFGIIVFYILQSTIFTFLTSDGKWDF